MPKPSENESKEEFISRCVSMVKEEGTAKDNEQAVAICFSMWEQHQKNHKKGM